MKTRILKNRKKLNIPVHEHLEFVVKHTTYADRLRWLEEANEFVRAIEKARKIIDVCTTKVNQFQKTNVNTDHRIVIGKEKVSKNLQNRKI